MAHVFYLGKNGKEYRTYDDALIYGEGVKGKRTQAVDLYEHINESDMVNSDEGMGLEELKELARQKGIKGYAMMKEDTLLKRIQEVSTEV